MIWHASPGENCDRHAFTSKLSWHDDWPFVADQDKECDACACQDTWTYNGPKGDKAQVEYQGCAKTPDRKGHDWCYVNDAISCKSANESAVKGETRKYKECDGCACQDMWSYNGPKGDKDQVNYQGCAETPDRKGHNWCYVNDADSCKSAKVSAVKGETRKYKECDPCACQDAWSYLGVEYQGCVETPDWKGNTWCFVNDAVSCKSAWVDPVESETRKYKLCVVAEAAEKFLRSDMALGQTSGFGGISLVAAAGVAALLGFVLLSMKFFRRAPTSRGSEMVATEEELRDGETDGETEAAEIE